MRVDMWEGELTGVQTFLINLGSFAKTLEHSGTAIFSLFFFINSFSKSWHNYKTPLLNRGKRTMPDRKYSYYTGMIPLLHSTVLGSALIREELCIFHQFWDIIYLHSLLFCFLLLFPSSNTLSFKVFMVRVLILDRSIAAELWILDESTNCISFFTTNILCHLKLNYK